METFLVVAKKTDPTMSFSVAHILCHDTELLTSVFSTTVMRAAYGSQATFLWPSAVFQ